ncbi:DUF1361 domain-containing protein [Christiangramia sp. SM2212]|uniref:DUF1361 domain-containing protein n=1 Tax=Christiangramia sediminicola TaxID=3073267 RepID=A0ABU1ERL2_9FLAO|nr:DUF1361 domain-containing protein [Christiangramia sp. SM2212]MDR5591006.1 DUF1361 domain-containing protein [Christiangramia sp. SM2212]
MMKLTLKPNVLSAAIFGCLLVVLRFLITMELHYIFLIWNLFLAMVPLGLSKLLCRQKFRLSLNLLLLGSWVLFLPNSFYVITDLIHLKNSNFLFYDAGLISFFAILCVSLGFLSMMEVKSFLHENAPKLNHWIMNIMLLFLCAFGIFLGRFLRYNSWNIVNDPISLFKDCFNFIRHPVEHAQVWFFTFGFGLLLVGLYHIFLKITEARNEIL